MDAALLLSSRLVLAAVFAVAGAAKLADMAGSRAARRGDTAFPSTWPVPLGTLLPFAELVTAALLLPGGDREGLDGVGLAFALLVLFGVGIAASMARGEAPRLPLLRPAALRAYEPGRRSRATSPSWESRASRSRRP